MNYDHVKELADKLAYECACLISQRKELERSGIGDALLNYLEIGQIGGWDSVPHFVKQYEKGTMSTCKWERCKKSPHIVFNPHEDDYEDEGREFCHICGKKIEVVE